MRTTQLYAPTLRETPAEAEVISHQLMLRAGMIRKAAGGVYTYLPLAWRVLKKIEEIVREEMDNAGGQELAMPIMQPAELWHETGRWDVYGDVPERRKPTARQVRRRPDCRPREASGPGWRADPPWSAIGPAPR